MSRRLCFALDLQDDPSLIAQYERYHAPGSVWPAVFADLRGRGFQNMSIWRTGNRLFMIAEVSADYPRRADDKYAGDVERWETLMSQFQMALPHAPPGVKWVPMQCIFDWRDQ